MGFVMELIQMMIMTDGLMMKIFFLTIPQNGPILIMMGLEIIRI